MFSHYLDGTVFHPYCCVHGLTSNNNNFMLKKLLFITADWGAQITFKYYIEKCVFYIESEHACYEEPTNS